MTSTVRVTDIYEHTAKTGGKTRWEVWTRHDGVPRESTSRRGGDCSPEGSENNFVIPLDIPNRLGYSLFIGRQSGRPKTGRFEMFKIAANHTNGYVKLAMVRDGFDVPAVVAALQARGYWVNITVTPWVPERRKGMR